MCFKCFNKYIIYPGISVLKTPVICVWSWSFGVFLFWLYITIKCFLPKIHDFCLLQPTTVVIEMLLTLGGRLSVPIYPSDIGVSAIAYNGLLWYKTTSQHTRIEILLTYSPLCDVCPILMCKYITQSILFLSYYSSTRSAYGADRSWLSFNGSTLALYMN